MSTKTDFSLTVLSGGKAAANLVAVNTDEVSSNSAAFKGAAPSFDKAKEGGDSVERSSGKKCSGRCRNCPNRRKGPA